MGFAQANTIYRDGEDVIQSYENAKRAVRTSGKFGGCPFNLNTLPCNCTVTGDCDILHFTSRDNKRCCGENKMVLDRKQIKDTPRKY